MSAPAHIIDQPGDRYSRCGIKDPLPVVWSRWARNHIDNYGLVVCEQCACGQRQKLMITGLTEH